MQDTPVHNTSTRWLSKVPEITLGFWLVKIFSTTVGETAADFLSGDLGLELTGTTAIMAALLCGSLVLQMRTTRYIANFYWLTIVFISIVGTLLTDILTDVLGVSLVVSTIVFAITLALTFGIWFTSEGTLSIHSITSRRREAFYWLAILLTFALGTAAGDLFAEAFEIGYLLAATMFAVLIGCVALAYYKLRLQEVLAFWLAYILTRPLGASLGDLLTQPHDQGGIGVSAKVISLILLVGIAFLVPRTKPDSVA